MKTENFTQENFDKLPMLVNLSTVVAWTGYDRRAVRALVENGYLQTHKRRPGGKDRYYKRDLARICNLEV